MDEDSGLEEIHLADPRASNTPSLEREEEEGENDRDDQSLISSNENTSYRASGIWKYVPESIGRRLQSAMRSVDLFSQKLNHRVEAFLQRSFFSLGLFVGNRPGLTVILSILFVLISAIGITQIIVPKDPEYAWSPFNSRARLEQAYVIENYGAFRVAFTIFQANHQASANVLDKAILLQAMQAHNELVSAKLTNPESHRAFSFSDVCFQPLPLVECYRESLLAFWDYDYETLLNDDDILATINTKKQTVFQTIDANDLLGGIKRDENGKVVSAEAFYIFYVIDDGPTKQSNTIILEKFFIDVFAPEQFNDLYVVRFTKQAAHDEIDRAVADDARLFSVSFVLMLLYVTLALGKFSILHSKFLLGLGGILTVILSIVCGFGIGGYIGTYWSPAAIAIPFLILGIGVDDMFIIVNGYHHSDASLGIPERLGKCLSSAGASITITSLTDFVAFLVGASTNLPALSSFCIYAAFSVLCDYFLQVTLFAAMLVFNEKRVGAQRIDCMPCVKVTSLPTPAQVVCARSDVDPESNAVSNFFRNYYAPALLSIYGKILVMVVAFLLVAASLYGAANSGSGLSQFDILPSDSYIFDYLEAEARYFSGEAVGIPLDIILKDIDYADPNVQDQVLNLTMEVKNSKYVESINPSWLEDFLSYLKKLPTSTSPGLDERGRPTSTESFYLLLYQWLPTAGREHAAEIMFQYGKIKSSKFSGKHARLDTDFTRADAIVELRRICDSYQPDIHAFPFDFRYLGWSPFINLIPNNLQSFALVLLSIFLITFAFLGDLKMSGLVFLTVILVDIDLIGVMYYWDIGVNIISIVNLLLALGLAVDASAHIIHAIMLADSANKKREKSQRISRTQVVINGLAYVGSSVFSGA